LNGFDVSSRLVYALSSPAGLVPPALGVPVGSETWPLSLSTTNMRVLR
jgi:hypothetical protein